MFIVLGSLPKRQGGVYRIDCLSNGRFYIGSSGDLRRRLQCHHTACRCQRQGCRQLQSDFNEFGESCFTFSVIEFVEDKSNILDREQHYLDALRPTYNRSPSSRGNHGLKMSEEGRRRLSERNTGLKRTQETKDRIRTGTTAAGQVRATKYEFNGELFTKKDMRNRLDCSTAVIQTRFRLGWSVDRIMSTPVDKKGPRPVRSKRP